MKPRGLGGDPGGVSTQGRHRLHVSAAAATADPGATLLRGGHEGLSACDMKFKDISIVFNRFDRKLRLQSEFR